MQRFCRLSTLDATASARLTIPPGWRWLHLLALLIAHTGDSLLWIAAAVSALACASPPWKTIAWRILAGTLITGLLVAVLKRTFRRHRPPHEPRGLYIGPDHYAFPSGHAARTACLALLLLPLSHPWCASLLSVWVLGVGLARVGLGIHFASDIIGGWLVGLAAGLSLLALGTLPSLPIPF
jgi:undecaprenyl-diphosphatase